MKLFTLLTMLLFLSGCSIKEAKDAESIVSDTVTLVDDIETDKLKTIA